MLGPNCAGAITYAWFSIARARSNGSQCASPVGNVNALGTVMILVTVGIPLLGGAILQGLTRLKRRGEPKEDTT